MTIKATATAALAFLERCERADDERAYFPTTGAPEWIRELFSGLGDWETDHVHSSLSNLADDGADAEAGEPEHRNWYLLGWLRSNVDAVDEVMREYGTEGIINACMLAQSIAISELHEKTLAAVREADEDEDEDEDEDDEDEDEDEDEDGADGAAKEEEA